MEDGRQGVAVAGDDHDSAIDGEDSFDERGGVLGIDDGHGEAGGGGEGLQRLPGALDFTGEQFAQGGASGGPGVDDADQLFGALAAGGGEGRITGRESLLFRVADDEDDGRRGGCDVYGQGEREGKAERFHSATLHEGGWQVQRGEG